MLGGHLGFSAILFFFLLQFIFLLFFMILTSKIGSFSEESNKIGRGFIKILETWQFGLSFNIMTRIFLFWPKKIFCRFYEFLKNVGLAQKKIVKSRYWL
jgi:hypothetical protein